METNSVGRVDEFIVPSAPPPPQPREEEPESETVAPEPSVDTEKRLDLYA
jgi:hypothetical protein